MAEVPDDLKYTAEHEWARISGSIGANRNHRLRPGVTGRCRVCVAARSGHDDHQGGAIWRGRIDQERLGAVWSVDGTVTARNDTLDGQPEVINSDPYGAGWIIEVEVADTAQFDALLDAGTYGTLSG